jgi:hypothetical protein
MGQKDGKKWTAAADLQPTISKSDRLLGLSLPALDNHVDKFWQALYGSGKWLICKGIRCIA